MSWRVINIGNEARLSVKNNQLSIKQEEEFSIPLEDIGVLILESKAISLTSALLSACANHKISLLTCDDKHLPNGVLTGYQNHSRQLKIINQQLSWTESFKKRLWQLIIKQKIKNQAYVAYKLTNNQKIFNDIISYEPCVNSGDTTNREGASARIYFSSVLPKNITRESEHKINSALNYGYALIRGVIARNIASYGFLSSIGIKHSNELNQFNLADDFIEPFRPLVDVLVMKDNRFKEGECLTPDDKHTLLNILLSDCFILENKQSIIRAIELTIQSLSSASENKNYELILLPKIYKND